MGTIRAHGHTVHERLTAAHVLVQLVLPAPLKGDDPHGAVRVGGHRGGHRTQQAADQPAPTAGTQDQQLGVLAQFEQHVGRVPGLDGGPDVHVQLGHAASCLAHEVLHGPVHGGVVERRVPHVERGPAEHGHGVGSDHVEGRAAPPGLTSGPVQGAHALLGAVHAHDDLGLTCVHGAPSLGRMSWCQPSRVLPHTAEAVR